MFNFLNDVWHTVLMMAPWLAVGAVCIGVLHVVLPRRFYASVLRGRGGVWRAVLFGVPLPLCSCAVIPVAVGMKRGGAPSSATVAFLVSTPQTGVDSILVTGGFLGWPFAIYRVFVALVMGLMGGGLTLAAVDAVTSASDENIGPARRYSLAEGALHAWTSLMAIWGWVIAGVLISALLTQFGTLTTFSSSISSPIVGCLLALAVAIPLYVCATASIPVAAALVSIGLPIEAALVFLIAGPATNAATIGAVHAVLGRRVTMIYLAVTIVGSVFFAWAFAYVLPDYSIEAIGMMDHGVGWIDALCGVAFVLVSILWMVPRFRALGAPEQSNEIDGFSVMPVVGMTCNGCVSRLQDRMDADSDTKGVIVELSPGRVRWQGDRKVDAIRRNIEGCGFAVDDTQA